MNADTQDHVPSILVRILDFRCGYVNSDIHKNRSTERKGGRERESTDVDCCNITSISFYLFHTIRMSKKYIFFYTRWFTRIVCAEWQMANSKRVVSAYVMNLLFRSKSDMLFFSGKANSSAFLV